MINKNIHIVEGNRKIGKTPNISLTPIESCVNSLYCRHNCYASYFYRRYKTARLAWDTNFRILKTDRDSYFSQIRRFLLKKAPRYFRWHVSGDIIDQDYFSNMKIIAGDYYFTKFLVFTKNYTLDFSKIPYNLSVILSIWPELEIPNIDLPLAFIDSYNETRSTNYLKCHGECESCRACWNLKKLNKNIMLKELKR